VDVFHGVGAPFLPYVLCNGGGLGWSWSSVLVTHPLAASARIVEQFF